jgi:predicted nucleic acid-binding Zn ribbon protein
MAGPGTLDSFGNILSGLAKRLGLESRLLELRLQHRWHEIVGEPMASHTWPAQIRFKKLYLVVRNSVWLQQLTFLKPALLTKLQAESGTDVVTDIACRVGEIPGGPEASVASLPTDSRSAQPEESRAEVFSYTAVIQDPALREHFRRVISAYPDQVPPPRVKDPSRVP